MLIAAVRVRRAGSPRPPLGLGLVPANLGALAILVLIAISLWVSVRTQAIGGAWTLQHYGELVTHPFVYRVFGNTFAFAGVTLVVAVLFGLPIAWLCERTDLPLKGAVYVVMTAVILLPGFATALGWLFLLDPREGLVNTAAERLLRLHGPLLDVVTIPGMGFVQGLALAPVVFVMASAGLRGLDSSLEEAARISGAATWRTVWRVTLPLLAPALVAALIFVFVISLAVFDVPAIIGLSARIYTFSTYLYQQVYPEAGQADYGFAAAFSTVMLVLALALSLIYVRVLRRARAYEVIGPRVGARHVWPLGRWAGVWLGLVAVYVLLAGVLPAATLLWTALLPFLQPPSGTALSLVSWDNFASLPWPQIQSGLLNTTVLMLGVPTVALVLSLSFSWLVLRSRLRARPAYDYVAFLPQAVPSITFAFSMLIATLFLLPAWSGLYGSVAAILIAMALVQVALGTRLTNGALVQISRELEEAAAVAGGSGWLITRRIVVPLMRPALVYGWLWMALLAYRELTMTAMLAGAHSSTLAVVTFGLFTVGQIGQAAALALVMLVILLPLLAIYLRFAGIIPAATAAAPRIPTR